MTPQEAFDMAAQVLREAGQFGNPEAVKAQCAIADSWAYLGTCIAEAEA